MADCIHHWVIPAPNGSSLLTATCKKCSSKREYLAAEPEMGWKALNNLTLASGGDDFAGVVRTYVAALPSNTRLD